MNRTGIEKRCIYEKMLNLFNIRKKFDFSVFVDRTNSINLMKLDLLKIKEYV